MTVSDKHPLPDWLVERAALGEVPAASRARLDRADPDELAARIAAVREASARELAAYPAEPAVAQIAARADRAAHTARRRSFYMASGALAGALALVVVMSVGSHHAPAGSGSAALAHDWSPDDDGTRVKGRARLAAFRQIGNRAEQLDPDALVHAGDVLQLRYVSAGRRFGVIASLDGAGVVTLHYPASESAPPAATAIAAEPTALPEAYALDDAPRFERFFFITSNQPIDVGQSLAAIKSLAAGDAADAELDLPWGQYQSSLRLLKPVESP